MASLILGAAATTGLSWWAAVRSGGSQPSSSPNPAPERVPAGTPRRGSLEWALALADADANTLLPAAGDLERVAARHSIHPLVPVFCRVLDLAVDSQAGFADAAAACAVRSLDLLRAPHQIQRRRDAVLQRADFGQAQRELERVTSSPRGGEKR